MNPIDARLSRTGEIAGGAPQREQIALQEMEHLFLYMLLQEMRKSTEILPDGTKGREQEMYNQMLNDALAGAMAESGQFGLAQQIETQLRAAESSRNTSAARDALEANGAQPTGTIGNVDKMLSNTARLPI
ncbi:MAG: hypothetical protein GWP08_15250 [Nitrospiraceae bacterium]|nr:hypothetical protein [Nitrospiraceae bacterium]